MVDLPAIIRKARSMLATGLWFSFVKFHSLSHNKHTVHTNAPSEGRKSVRADIVRHLPSH